MSKNKTLRLVALKPDSQNPDLISKLEALISFLELKKKSQYSIVCIRFC